MGVGSAGFAGAKTCLLSQEGEDGGVCQACLDGLNKGRMPHFFRRMVTYLKPRVNAARTRFWTKKKATLFRWPFFLMGVWRCATLAWGNPKLPSPLIRFTSEFEMGSGGTVSLWPSDKIVQICWTKHGWTSWTPFGDATFAQGGRTTRQVFAGHPL